MKMDTLNGLYTFYVNLGTHTNPHIISFQQHSQQETKVLIYENGVICFLTVHSKKKSPLYTLLFPI